MTLFWIFLAWFAVHCSTVAWCRDRNDADGRRRPYYWTTTTECE